MIFLYRPGYLVHIPDSDGGAVLCSAKLVYAHWYQKEGVLENPESMTDYAAQLDGHQRKHRLCSRCYWRWRKRGKNHPDLYPMPEGIDMQAERKLVQKLMEEGLLQFSYIPGHSVGVFPKPGIEKIQEE